MESPESPIAPSLFQHPRSLLSSAERDADFAPEAAGPSKPCSYTTTVEVIADSPTAVASPSTSARTSASYVTDRADPNCPEPRLSARSHFESPMDDVRFRDGELRSDKSIWVEPAFDYTPNRGDELKLKRGSTIKVIRCNEDEEGWWYGETVDGKKGYFPQSYVKLAERKPIEINMDDLKVTGTLGTGGFGIVKSAMYRGREVAVKIPNSKFSRDKIAELVKEEASILQMIHHRNFIRLFGIVIGERPALVLELCQDSLSKISQRSRGAWISAQTIAFWGAQIARGMSYLHQLNVLHRDLKAANILVKEKVCESCLKYSIGPDEHVPYILDDGFCKECGGAGLRRLTLKIADLGLSKRIQFSNCINRISVMGTVSYLAPEVVVRKLCSKAMDVWSFGLILWEVLTGTTPFAGMCPSIAILQIGHYRKQEIPSSCPVELKEIIESCWCRDPEDRPTFKLLATQLQTLSETCEAPDFSRRNFMKEAQTLLKNMKEKADELQRRENEITIRELGRILVQAMSLEPPKVKPTPPKRKPFLTTSDISKPYDYKEGLSLTKNIHMDLSNNDDECDRCAQVESRRASDFPSSPHKENIEVRCRKFSEPPHVPMQGFLTIPRRSKNEDLPKKLSNDVDKLMNEMDAEFPSTRELLNPLYKSTPNLLRSHMPVYRDSSPQLHRCNATRRIMKEPPRRTDPDCNFSGGRDYETLKEQGSRFTSLDHLATPRRIPPSGVNIYGSRPNVRVTLANGNRYHLKTGRDSDWNFLNFFKFYKEKSPLSQHPFGARSPSPNNPILFQDGSSTGTPSRRLFVFPKSPSTPKKQPGKVNEKKRSKVSVPAGETELFALTKESKTYVKSKDHVSGATSVNCDCPRTPARVPYIPKALSPNREGGTDRHDGLSGADGGILENVGYVSPASRDQRRTSPMVLPLSDCQQSLSAQSPSTSRFPSLAAANNGGSSSSLLENQYYVSANKMETSKPRSRDVSSDGSLEQSNANQSNNSLTDESETSRGMFDFCLDDPIKAPSVEPQEQLYVDIGSLLHQNQLKKTRFPTVPETNSVEVDQGWHANDGDVHFQRVGGLPDELSAPAADVVTHAYLVSTETRPERPYTLDLNHSVTPTESGIWTGGSSSRSLPSADPVPLDHSVKPPSDSREPCSTLSPRKHLDGDAVE